MGEGGAAAAGLNYRGSPAGAASLERESGDGPWRVGPTAEVSVVDQGASMGAT